MREENLSQLSLYELNQRKGTVKAALIAFVIVLSILIGVVIFNCIINGITPMIGVPIALSYAFVLLIQYQNKINTELKVRME